MHNQNYVPAMQGFHFRLGNRRLPIPEPMFKNVPGEEGPLLETGIWEGYLLKGLNGESFYPDVIVNVDALWIEKGIKFTVDLDGFSCEKQIILEDNKIIWQYKMKFYKSFQSCSHILPVLMHDGKHGTRWFERSPNQLECLYDNSTYLISCNIAKKMSLSLQRSLSSVSGLATQIRINISDCIQSGEVLEWSTQSRRE